MTNIDASAILFNAYIERGLPLRNGTGSYFAFQNIEIPTLQLHDYQYNTNLTTLLPKYTCTLVGSSHSQLRDDGSFDVRLDTDPCPSTISSKRNDSSTSTELTMSAMLPWSRNSSPDFRIYVDYYGFPCPEFLGSGSSPMVSIGGHSVRGVNPSVGSTDFFFLNRIGVSKSNCDAEPTPFTMCDLTASLDEVMAIACRVDFEIGDASIIFEKAGQGSVDANLHQMHPHASNDTGLDANFNATLLQSVIPLMLDAARELSQVNNSQASSNLFVPSQAPALQNITADNSSETSRDWRSTFQFFAKAGGGDGAWLTQTGKEIRPEDFERSVQTSLNGFLAQWASLTLYRRDTSTRPSDLSYVEDRLHISVLSMSLMIFGLSMMAMFTFIIIKTKPDTLLDRSPAAILDLALLLSSDKSLKRQLQETGPVSYEPAMINARTWYRPLAARRPVGITIILLPLSLIAVLQVLQFKSDRGGIVQIGNQTSFAFESWTHYLPTAVMVLIAIAYACLEFNILLFSPFSKLKKTAPGWQSISQDLNMQMSLEAVVNAMRKKQHGAALSIIAALCASTLTIPVSGLFRVDTLPYQFSSTFTLRSDIPSDLNINSGADSKAAWTLLSIDKYDLRFPT